MKLSPAERVASEAESERALTAAWHRRRCRCGAPAVSVAPGSDPVVEVGIRLSAGIADRNRCLRHLTAWRRAA